MLRITKLFWLVLFLLLLPALSFAQRGTIKGIVYSDKDKAPVEYASIQLMKGSDSTYLEGAITPKSGAFSFKVKPGQYIVRISYLTLRDSVINTSISPNHLHCNLDTIYLPEKMNELEGAVIVGQAPDVVVRNDTIEYNARNFKVGEEAMLQDLVKKLPGVEFDADGNLTANGKPVTKILIDGKEFFGSDIQVALVNLPANMIDKLQLFKEESEMTKLTGIKDGDEKQVMNLKTKAEIKQSIFGNIEAGYGTDNRYHSKGMVNYITDATQLALIGNAGNATDNMSLPQGADFMLLSEGKDTNKNIGANFSLGNGKKFSTNGSLMYRNNENNTTRHSSNQTFLNTGDRFSQSNNLRHRRNNTLNAEFSFDWKPDTLTTIFFHSSFGHSVQNSGNRSSSLSYVNADTTTTAGHSSNRLVSDNGDFSLHAGRKFSKKGRSLNLALRGSFRNGDSDGTNKTTTIYPHSDGVEVSLDQISNTESKGGSFGATLSYVEPLTEKDFLNVSYSFNRNTSKNDRSTLKKDSEGNYTLIDTAYTRFTKNEQVSNNINLSFQSIREKYNYNVGFSISPSVSKSLVRMRDSLIEDARQSVVNFSPSLGFSYRPNEKTSLDLRYSGNTVRPSLGQLSADTLVHSTQSMSYGNPDLKSGFNNSLNLNLMKSNTDKHSYLYASLSFSANMNTITNYTIIDSLGNTETSYRNVNGNMNGSLFMYYNAPMRNKKFRYMLNPYGNFSRRKGFTNGQLSTTNSFTLGQTLSISFLSDKLDCGLKTSFSHTFAKNNLTNAQDLSSTNWSISGNFTWNLPLDFELHSDVKFSQNSGYSSSFKNSSILWNVSVAKKMLKNKKGLLKFGVFDILDDRNTTTRYVYEDGISESRTNTVSRYCMLSFSYKFSIFKGGESSANDDFGGMYY
ncbi:hypothetical protein M2132_001865 [Dysgonomonas sp. PH5-45]|uniref:outer membrane beta-barrel protein n=1 Tax=unclassified Dysgonomonas TaxID=2630389 RepID=UPI002476E50C|nr:MULTISPECIES: outer membrane beta-barrel protein [unclassified Dysgonomonas]MDH6355520.1 hypothetical protein [Dysgonomonas sp. PH5-45]MDH6388419.1 hypothetical protein [Dysgonomonas sp. PH5-37]